MDLSKIPQALDTEFESRDLGRVSLRGYLKHLLFTLLEEEESFSGKRPFGNSGWQYDIDTALIKAGVVEGSIDEDGFGEADEDASQTFDALVEELCRG